MVKKIRRAASLGAATVFCLAGCASTNHVMTGTARPPITPDQVKVYWQPPARFEKIALLDATAHSAFVPGGQKTVDKVVERLRAAAAKLGANGVIVGDFSDAQTSSIGTGVGRDSYTHYSSVSLGVGGSFGVFKKTGWAQAVYVTAADASAAGAEPAEPDGTVPQATEPPAAPPAP